MGKGGKGNAKRKAASNRRGQGAKGKAVPVGPAVATAVVSMGKGGKSNAKRKAASNRRGQGAKDKAPSLGRPSSPPSARTLPFTQGIFVSPLRIVTFRLPRELVLLAPV